MRHLHDQVPDTRLPEMQVDFPPLAGKPRRERFDGPLKPIKSA